MQAKNKFIKQKIPHEAGSDSFCCYISKSISHPEQAARFLGRASKDPWFDSLASLTMTPVLK